MSIKNSFQVIRVTAVFLLLCTGMVMAGSLADFRDGQEYFRNGQTYKTVKIGTQTWMAENLNYKSDNSWCYENNAANCQKYGRLYTWERAMTACPDGWHLPGDNEWQTLYDYVYANNGEERVSTSLKSVRGWWRYEDLATGGTDRFGFSALPAGYRDYHDYDGYFDDDGIYANFWSATEYGSTFANYWRLSYAGEDVFTRYTNKNFGFSVRCLKD